MVMTPQEMGEHCGRLRARLWEKKSELTGMDPGYAAWTRHQITAMERRVEEIEASLPALRRENHPT